MAVNGATPSNTGLADHETEFAWFLPTSGDTESFGDRSTEREATFDYLVEVAQAAEAAGFSSALVPVGDSCQDAWVVAALAAPLTKDFKFLVAVRPGFVAPVVAAKMVSTFDRLTGGRLLVNVVTGGFPAELAADGDFTPHDRRYQRTREFIEVMKKYWTERRFDHEGEFYRVEGCKPAVRCLTEPYPPLYAGGASEIAEDVFADSIDCYLLWGETIPQMTERIERMSAKAAAHGKALRFGVRLHVLARATHEEAVAAAEQQVAGVPEEHVERVQKVLKATDSAGESRQRVFAGRDDLWPEENLWAGVGKVRRGIGLTVVGSYEEVARKFLTYSEMGLSYFILSGYPHLEEARIAGEHWLPLFRELNAGRTAGHSLNHEPFQKEFMTSQ
ncbi:MAG: LLM class flavin-dependent oxidoreductase [Dehalococcoidia bacterium]